MPNEKPAPPNALLLRDMFEGCFQCLRILYTLYYGDLQSRIATIQHTHKPEEATRTPNKMIKNSTLQGVDTYNLQSEKITFEVIIQDIEC